ncbi:MAG TPA: CoA-transferase [Thermomicrobiales bacterium]|nr:CoA-transferase [Thermomicrobiales bacterium]
MPSIASIADLMAVCLARLIRDSEVVLQGVGSPLPLVAIALARATHAPQAVALSVAGGVNASPARLARSSADPALAAGAAAVFANDDFYDLCARGKIDLAFLGAVQIDAQGRTNVSAIGDYARPKVRLPGGGGAAMILPTARRVVLWRTRHDRRTFVERLDFVTGAGNVDRVVTSLAVLRRVDGRLTLESVHCWSTVKVVREHTGFALPAPDSVPPTPPPTAGELAALADVDPERVRDLEWM